MSHGLAGSIRGSLASETFDLAGLSVSTIENTIRDAFQEPFDLSEMIRLTFVTGAGKLGRARYDENCAKALTSVLRELGYEEDRGASAVMECAGLFKLQHDTGKNLKTVVVFPKVRSVPKTEESKNSASGSNLIRDGLSKPDSVHHKLAYTSMNVFPLMIERQTVTWSQKKACVSALSDILQFVKELDETLLKGHPVSESDQDIYNSISVSSLEEKMSCVREMMQKQIEVGAITGDEKKMLLQQVEMKLKELREEIVEAEKQSKHKRVENLRTAESKALSRKEKLDAIVPRSLPKLKNEAQIHTLRCELQPLLQLEDASKGRLLTLKESQAIARKNEIQEQIQELELSSRGWFETDEGFEERVKASRLKWKPSKTQNVKKAKTQDASTTVSSSFSKMGLVRKPTAPGVSQSQKKVSGSGGLFAAMMQDSSDSE